ELSQTEKLRLTKELMESDTWTTATDEQKIDMLKTRYGKGGDIGKNKYLGITPQWKVKGKYYPKGDEAEDVMKINEILDKYEILSEEGNDYTYQLSDKEKRKGKVDKRRVRRLITKHKSKNYKEALREIEKLPL